MFFFVSLSVYLFLDSYEYHMDLCKELYSSIWLASQPAILGGKNVNIGHYVQIVQPIFFIPTMLIDTIDFLPFDTTFTDFDFACGSLGQHEAKPNASFSCTLFI